MKKISLPKAIAILILILVNGFIIIALLSSCSAQSRYKRLIKKHPELIQTDTVRVVDTIVKELRIPIPRYKDSFIITHDTIIETKKIILKKKGNKFSLDVKPDTITFRDTIPFEVKVPGKIVTIEKTSYKYLWITLILGLVLGMILKRR